MTQTGGLAFLHRAHLERNRWQRYREIEGFLNGRDTPGAARMSDAVSDAFR